MTNTTPAYRRTDNQAKLLTDLMLHFPTYRDSWSGLSFAAEQTIGAATKSSANALIVKLITALLNEDMNGLPLAR